LGIVDKNTLGKCQIFFAKVIKISASTDAVSSECDAFLSPNPNFWIESQIGGD
jgi:hypothetical protein